MIQQLDDNASSKFIFNFSLQNIMKLYHSLRVEKAIHYVQQKMNEHAERIMNQYKIYLEKITLTFK